MLNFNTVVFKSFSKCMDYEEWPVTQAVLPLAALLWLCPRCKAHVHSPRSSSNTMVPADMTGQRVERKVFVYYTGGTIGLVDNEDGTWSMLHNSDSMETICECLCKMFNSVIYICLNSLLSIEWPFMGVSFLFRTQIFYETLQIDELSLW